MYTLKASKRNTVTNGQLKKLRSEGFIPAILYGGSKDNVKLSLKKNSLKDAISNETFMSQVVDLEVEGSKEKVLPREMEFDPITSEPIHIDFMRIVSGTTLILDIPVNFINNDKSPGLKKGGVLNVVRRKVELRCPADKIPNEITVNLENTEIGNSLKISSVKLPENIVPTITDRDFTIATIVSPTIIVEPVKETVAEEGVVEGEAEKTAEGDAQSSMESKTTDKTKIEEKAKPEKEKAKPEKEKTEKKPK